MPDGALSRHADWARRWVPFALGLVAIGMATKSETPVDHPFGNANSRDEPGAMQAARAALAAFVFQSMTTSAAAVAAVSSTRNTATESVRAR